MQYEWDVTPAGAHVARDAVTREEVGNVYATASGQLIAHPWAAGPRAIATVATFEQGRRHVEDTIAAIRQRAGDDASRNP